MTDLKTLREVATQAARRNWMDADMQEFDDAFRPVAVLALLDRIEELEGAARAMVHAIEPAILVENDLAHSDLKEPYVALIAALKETPNG
jgi:hypothetical protein